MAEKAVIGAGGGARVASWLAVHRLKWAHGWKSLTGRTCRQPLR